MEGGRGRGGQSGAGLVNVLFAGKLRATVTCGSCCATSVKTEYFRDLALDVVSLAAPSTQQSAASSSSIASPAAASLTAVCLSTLEAAIQHYMNALPVDTGAASYCCAACSNRCTASRQVRFQRLPPVLPIV
jgi:hypothetical protein